MPRLHFTIASPERVVFESEIDQVSLPTKLGEITLLPHHIPLISSLSAGEVVITKDATQTSLAISGGFLEITKDHVTLLADTAERSDEIDEARAEEAKQRALSLLKEKRSDAVEYAALMAKIEKEFARLRVVRKRRKL